MSLKPAAELLGFWLERRAELWVVVEHTGGVRPATIFEANLWMALKLARHEADDAMQSGREAGFAEAIAAGLTSLASESANWERNEERVIEFCMARLRALKCPAADGSEGSDGE